MDGRHPVGRTRVGPGLARRLVGSGARLLIGLRTRVPQEQVRGHVVHHHIHRHPVHVEKGDAHLVRSDEKVVGLYKHRGEGEVRCVRSGLYFELVGAARQQHAGCIRARGSIEYACMELHVAQSSCQLGRIAVFGQRLKPIPAISFTGCEKGAGVAMKHPNPGCERRCQGGVAGNVFDADQKGDRILHGLLLISTMARFECRYFTRPGSARGPKHDSSRKHQRGNENH